MTRTDQLALGATPLVGGRCRFHVWAPKAQSVDVRLIQSPERIAPMQRGEHGYWWAELDEVPPGTLYYFRLDGRLDRPDPASRFQPQGVHGASAVGHRNFHWNDQAWIGLPLADYVLYELHVGTFTPAGTFEGVIEHLDALAELGITAIELMPVAEFPGNRNWGYDGVNLFAPHHAYGGPTGLKRLVDAAHRRGLAVVLDVVYNHFGPEGNYLADFGPYFTDRYCTPWGAAINFDGRDSDHVRRLLIDNALYWVGEFHVDGLRLDAVQAIFDQRAVHFLRELADEVHAEAGRLGRRVCLVAESNLNDPRLVQPATRGGYGLDGQWLDDFCYALHALVTGERLSHYLDFGSLNHLAKAYSEGFVLSGDHSAYRRRQHGTSSKDVPPQQFVAFAQNHDQVGNRPGGERLSRLVEFESLKLAAAAVILSPYVPLVFMGEEYGENAPFHYFVSHSNPKLVEGVRRGRQRWFDEVGWPTKPPDPQAPATFDASRLDHSLRTSGRHAVLWNFYRELLRLRKSLAALQFAERDHCEIIMLPDRQILVSRRRHGDSEACVVLHFGQTATVLDSNQPQLAGRWDVLLDSSDVCWSGPEQSRDSSLLLPAAVPLHPRSCLLLQAQESNREHR